MAAAILIVVFALPIGLKTNLLRFCRNKCSQKGIWHAFAAYTPMVPHMH